MKKQLKIQASSISRILKCPGSCTLESKLPDRLRYFAFKDAAEYGTLCHAWGESILTGRYAAGLRDGIDAHPRAGEIFFIGDTYAQKVIAHKLPASKLYVEEKFRTTLFGVDCVAKSDAYYVGKKAIRKFDLKSGNFDYGESAGKQMEYAARLWCYINDEHDGRKIETYTVQPAFYNDARRVVISEPVVFCRSEFSEFIAGIKNRQKEFNAGQHCKMCGAILTCKTVKNLVEEFFEMAKKATKEDLAFKEIYLKRDAVLAFLDALDAHVKQELETGKVIPGLCLEEYSGRRKWIDKDIVVAKLAYLKDARFEPRELKSPAQMERIAGKENIAGLYDSPRLKRVIIRVNNFERFEV